MTLKMGQRHSVYERTSLDDYYRLNSEERELIRNAWIDIENNPQFHGNAVFMSFCKVNPQYIKYFSMNHHHLYFNFDPRTIAKFTVIMEALGFILLDFSNKPKQLNRLLGYIAMIHKDMALERRDFTLFHVSLMQYLAHMFPTQMDERSHDVFNKYLNSVLNEVCRKMDEFRQFDTLDLGETTEASLLTMLYWVDRKREWEERLNEWTKKSPEIMESGISSTDDDDLHKSRTEDEASEAVESQEKRSIQVPLQQKDHVDLPKTSKPSAQGVADLDESSTGLDETTSTQEMKKKSRIEKTGDLSPSNSTDVNISPRERHRMRRLLTEGAVSARARRREYLKTIHDDLQ